MKLPRTEIFSGQRSTPCEGQHPSSSGQPLEEFADAAALIRNPLAIVPESR